MTPDGLTISASNYSPKETMDRLTAAVTDRGMTVLARVDHAAAAGKAGMELRPTEVLIFGNPKAGTPLMQVAQTMGIDLPLKALVWQDDNGKTWLAYPTWLLGCLKPSGVQSTSPFQEPYTVLDCKAFAGGISKVTFLKVSE